MLDLMQTISMQNINIDGIKTIKRNDKNSYEVTCYVTGLEQFQKLTLALKKYLYVEDIERVIR